MLMCSLGWDYGLQVDLPKQNPLDILSMDWSTDGYQLFMVRKQRPHPSTQQPSKTPPMTPIEETPKLPKKQPLIHTHSNASTQSSESLASQLNDANFTTSLVQLDFVKSVLAVNPCMVRRYI